MTIRILTGDCRDVLKTLPDASVDSVLTDPPYELGFMSKKWDSAGVAHDPAVWRECLRVLKPGGHLLAFSGTRTQHRMVCAIEDVGFEIRDQIGWAFGSGFPKSLDVSKAIDKAAGAERTKASGIKPGHEEFVNRTDPHAAGGNADGWDRPWKFDADAVAKSHMTFEPATEAAKQWEGWGTALKPAWEPICVARKPLIGTVAVNVLAHGTGALNIDGCRIEVTDQSYKRNASGDRGHAGTRTPEQDGVTDISAGGGSASALGRWPANLLHDGSPEVVALFPSEAGAASRVTGDEPSMAVEADGGFVYGARSRVIGAFHGDGGSAARFFWCPKTSASDRHDGLQHPGQQFTNGATLRAAENLERKGNHHPTVKPTELMRYLCRLVTPPGGTVLDPFMGSGSTLKAAELEGFSAIGIELDPAYVEIARRRIASDAPLFAEVRS